MKNLTAEQIKAIDQYEASLKALQERLSVEKPTHWMPLPEAPRGEE